MILIFKYFIIISILNRALKSEAILASNIASYIRDKWQDTENFYTTIYNKNFGKIDDAGKWIKLWSTTTLVKRPHIISLFDQLFIVERQKFVYISGNPNSTRTINAVNFKLPEKYTRFVKTFEWNGFAYLLICQSACLLYRGTNSTNIKYWEKFVHDNLTPKDAIFFIHQNFLYLLISHYISDDFADHSTNIKIYLLEDNDPNLKFQLLFPSSVESIASFTSNESTMLLFVYNEEPYTPTNCYVYEFQFKSQDVPITLITTKDAVESVYIYNYNAENFILLKDNANSIGIYQWNGSNLERVITIPEIKSARFMSVITVNNVIYLFACNTDKLHTYKIINNNFHHLKEFDLPCHSDYLTVQIKAWNKENLIRIVHIFFNERGFYETNLWQTYFDEEKSEITDYNEVLKCFAQVKNLLKSRIPIIETLKQNFRNQESLKILSPLDTKNKLTQLDDKIKIILAESKNILANNKIVSFLGNTVINESAHFQYLYIDYLNVEYLNNHKIEFENIFIPETDQNFSFPLQAKSLYFHNLEISSFCGLDFEFWLQTDDLERTKLLSITGLNDSFIRNDTIFVQTDMILKKLNTGNINGMNIKNFFDGVFLLGKNQFIKGDITYKGLLQAKNLTTKEVNNVASSMILTKHTNQALNDVYIDTLQVEHLIVGKINGVSVNEAAKMDQENIIKGKVTIGTLIITDELLVKENMTLPLTLSCQVYEDIIIKGNIFIKNLEIDVDADLIIGSKNISLYNIQNILENSWSKSSNQIIKNSVQFKKGVSVDELTSEYINGCNKQDFLFVDSYEIMDLNNIIFNNFQFYEIINEETGIAESFLNNTYDKLIFYKTIRISQLSVDTIYTKTYNGIRINDIMQANSSFKFLRTAEFEAVHVVDQMTVSNLRMVKLNLKETSAFKRALRLTDNLEANKLNASSMNIRHLYVRRLCNTNLEEILKVFETLNNQTNNLFLTVDGEIEVEKGIKVNKINEQDTTDYLDIFRTKNLVDVIETRNIKNLHIIESLNISFLNSQNVTDIFRVALSKTNKQIIKNLSVLNINLNYLTAKIINNKNVSNLMYIDEPCIFYGNTTFSKLSIEGSVTAKTLNNQHVEKIQKNLEEIPMKHINSLLVLGNISWNNPSLNKNSINNLFCKAITKHENQLINSSVSFEGPLIIQSLHLNKEDSLILGRINEIISDAFIDNLETNSEMVIRGTKVFTKGLSVSDIEVTNNINIKTINGIDIEELNSQIFRKFNNDSISAQIIFLGNIDIGKLVTNKNIHDIPLHELAIKGKTMPTNLHFEHLIVEGNVSLHQLDGVDFDDFKKRRICINEDVEIFVDVEFNKPVTVLNESYISFINGIKPTNLVVDATNYMPNIIYGRKTFASELIIENDIETPKINNLDVDAILKNSLSKNETFDIFGNIIFEFDVETSGNINVFGTVNDVTPQDIIHIQSLQRKWAEGALNKEELLINNLIKSSSNISTTSSESLLYLEVDDKLSFYFAEVQSFRSIQVGSITRLDIYATEDARFCNLQNNCYCRRQYVVDISSSESYKIYAHNSSNVTYNFYDSNGLFGVQLVSDVVSTSSYCSKNTSSENSKIFWKKISDSTKKEIKMNESGFISDAQLFVNNDRVYLILAIFYDKTINSYAAESILYEINLQNDEVKIVQTIPTDGAKSVHVFQTNNEEIYALIGCVKGKGESLLLRFDNTSRQFQFIQTFATGGSKHVASVIRENNSFVILNNPDIEALQIFIYNSSSDTFNDYQNLYFESRVISLNVFYSGDIGRSQAFIVTATKDGWLFIYEYMFFGKFQLTLSYWIEDVQTVSSFRHINQNYLFVGSKSNSTVYKVIQQ